MGLQGSEYESYGIDDGWTTQYRLLGSRPFVIVVELYSSRRKVVECMLGKAALLVIEAMCMVLDRVLVVDELVKLIDVVVD